MTSVLVLVQIPQDDGVQRQLRNDSLQLCVLVFQMPQSLRIADVHASELRLPVVERRR